MSNETSSAILPACEVLSGFDENDRRTLTAYGRFLSYKPGAMVIQENERQECLYFLVEGVLKAVHKTKTGVTPLGSIKSGEWFGEINIFDPHTSSAMVLAHTASRAWSISRPRLEEFLNDQPALGCLLLLGVGEVLARRTRDMVAKLNATWELSW